MREMVNLEQSRAETWKERAEAAERWHWEAAAIMAEISRRYALDVPAMTKVRALLNWAPS
jgi:hypothetical protein